MASSIRRMYGYNPVDFELYKTKQEKELAEQKVFNYMDLISNTVRTPDYY